MGNNIFRTAFNRENLSRIFMLLPRWLLPVGLDQNKPLTLPNVQEEDSYSFPPDDDDDDSAFFCTPIVKEQTDNVSNKRRMTFSYTDANSMHLHALTEEIKALRETVADLVSNNLVANKNDGLGKIDENAEGEVRENWKEIQNEENFNIKRRKCRSFIEVKENLKNEGMRPNLKEVLKDLRNVKLRPVNSSTPKRVPANDVRNDLHKILLRRFSAMHSPIFSTNKRNSLSYNRRSMSIIGTDSCHNDLGNCDSASESFTVHYEDSSL